MVRPRTVAQRRTTADPDRLDDRAAQALSAAMGHRRGGVGWLGTHGHTPAWEVDDRLVHLA